MLVVNWALSETKRNKAIFYRIYRPTNAQEKCHV